MKRRPRWKRDQRIRMMAYVLWVAIALAIAIPIIIAVVRPRETHSHR